MESAIINIRTGVDKFIFIDGNCVGNCMKKSETNPEGNAAMKLFALQLFLNFWWSIIFFRSHSLSAAFAVVLILLTLIIITIFKFSKLSKTSSWLMVPYAAWVSFASILNYTLLTLN
jgi:tryptophan-rich sensory protein